MPNNGSLKFPADALARPDYRPGDYLLADDLTAGQSYLQQRMRRHNRTLHGTGVICGMRVAPANDPSQPWGVYVCPGYAIAPYGDEVILTHPELLDVSEFLWMNFSSRGLPALAYVGISYTEKPVKPVPAPAAECQCLETQYAPSRIKDSYRLSVLWTYPEELPIPFDICSGNAVPCKPCPESPYLLLARIILPPSVGTAIIASNIVNL